MKKNAFIWVAALVAGLTITSCSSSDDASIPTNPTSATEKVYADLVASNDFQFSSNGTVLSTTLPATRATVVTDEDVKLALIDTTHVEVNLNVSEYNTKNEYLSAHLSVHLRSANDVEVNLPIPNKYWITTKNASGKEVAFNQSGISIDNSEEVTGADGTKYVVTRNFTKAKEQKLVVEGDTVKLKVEITDNNVKITTDGMNEDILGKLKKKYGDGLTVEVWHYFKKGTEQQAIKDELDGKATVSFTGTKPLVYVNAIAKVNNYTGKVYTAYDEKSEKYVFYTKENNGVLSEPLDSKYYAYPETGNTDMPYLLGEANKWDLKVVPAVSYENKAVEYPHNITNFNQLYYDNAIYNEIKKQLEK